MTTRKLASALSLALLCGAAPAVRAQEPTGAIRGTVYDKDFAVPLGQVRVSVVEAMTSTLTTEDGHFLFERVPAGSYTLWLRKDGYERGVIANVVVTPGGLADERGELIAEVVDMEELVVSGVDLLGNSEAGLLEIRADAAAVQDAVSAELMGKAGASDVAGALKLVVGASVVDGKYATVRGLSDRYTGTTLNGVRIPSADPRRRAVQIDLFPTGTIDSITVSKTFTPDQQGDSTGGSVDIRTRSIPDAFVLAASVAEEYNTNATANSRYLTYRGGGVTFLGSDDERDLPAVAREPIRPIPSFSPNPPAQARADAEDYDTLTRAFAPVMGVSRGTPGPNYGFSLVVGNRFALGTNDVLGAMGALTYSRKYDFYEDGKNNSAGVSDAQQAITITSSRTDSRGNEELLIGGLGSLVWRHGEDHELSLDVVRNQSTEDEARLQVKDIGFPSVELNQSLRYTERKVGSNQLHGKHAWRKLKIDWFAAANDTRQDEPDVRFFRYTFDTSVMTGRMPANSTEAQNTRRFFREIAEDNLQGRINASRSFQLGGQEGTIQAGLYADRSDRTYDQRSFMYIFPNQLGSLFNTAAAYNRSLAFFLASRPDELWTDSFLDPGRIGLAGNRCPPGTPSNTCAVANQLLWVLVPLPDDVDYTGDQRIDAFYGMAEVPLGSRFQLIAGARSERTSLAIVPVNDAFGVVEVIEVLQGGDRGIVEVPQAQAQAAIDERSLLPAVGLVGKLSPAMNLRLSWSRTIARPTFRELAPVAAEEFVLGDEYIGNPALVLSDITNYDLRWEWFRRAGGVLSVSGFYKDIQNPIELISFSAGGRSFIQPVNYEQGKAYGAELEAQTLFALVSDKLRHFRAGANYTWIQSEVMVPASERDSLSAFGLDEPTRQLLGQPAYLLNLNLEYDNEAIGTTGGLFYNRVGETLLTGAARGSEDGNPNVYEESFDTLDLKVTGKIGRIFSVSVSAKNLLRPERRTIYRRPSGEEAVKTERETATLYSISGTWSW